MGNKVMTFVVLMLVMCYGVSVAVGYTGDQDEGWRRGTEKEEDWREEQESGGRRRPEEEEGHYPESGGEESEEGWFLLPQAKQVVKTAAGEMRVVMSARSRVVDKPMHIGFITMEPKSLFIPHYLDSNLILFVRRGEVKVGLIYKDELGERRLKTGDVYRIPAGSPFYLVNTGEGQRVHIICSIDTSESLGMGLQSFFIGGGSNPQSIIAGFDHEILANAFNLKQQDRLQEMKRMFDIQQDDHQDKSETWSWRKLLNSVFGADSNENKRRRDDYDKGKGKGKPPDSYNLYDRKPDFRNDYGWSMQLDDSDYSPLKHSGIGVYLVNLTAGSMMAPHVNPRATEYGTVLRGSGTLQIVFPNGTQAMNANIEEGDVFWVPRYFPFCQIASRTGPLEFFGFTTSARKNRPQILVGAASVLQELKGPELAAAFGVTEDRLRRFVDAQREAVILPTAQAAPPYKEERKPPKEEEEERRQQHPEEGERREDERREGERRGDAGRGEERREGERRGDAGRGEERREDDRKEV
ncbi:hypothetical protein C1H46_023345 [Malus baccata]|uniref:Cupin type-1 domain-containing protein n=1 Tax=Malus baccata TaxID=106549 RepID=A0A540LX30_MALBA|nr:hypothetical protein C1H46_023345 [Malus baccata]